MKKSLFLILVIAAMSTSLMADTFTLQNDGVTNPVTDTYIRMSNPTTAYYDNLLKATVTTTDRRVALLKFDLPSEVTSATSTSNIASATLTLNVDTTYFTAGDVYLYQMGFGSDWDENVTYYTYDGTNNWAGVSAGSNPCRARMAETEIYYYAATTQSPVTFDVTEIVRNWTAAGGDGNYGFLFAPYDTDGTGGYPGYNGTNINFYSSRHTDDYSLTPKLVIETAVPEPATMSLLALGGAACLIRRKKDI